MHGQIRSLGNIDYHVKSPLVVFQYLLASIQRNTFFPIFCLKNHAYQVDVPYRFLNVLVRKMSEAENVRTATLDRMMANLSHGSPKASLS